MKPASWVVVLLAILFLLAINWSRIRELIYINTHPGVVGFDFGILSYSDIERSIRPRSDRSGTFDYDPYPYWLCFNKRYLRAKCNLVEPLEEQGSIIDIDVETENAIHSYSHSHAISGEVCLELEAQIRKVTANRTHFCINGTDWHRESSAKKKEFSWSFYRIKTRDGYAEYRLDR